MCLFKLSESQVFELTNFQFLQLLNSCIAQPIALISV